MELNTEQKQVNKKAKANTSVQSDAKPIDCDALIEKYLPFATSIASKVVRSLPAEADFDEILCNARLGLLEAARRFDSRFNVDFKTFAYYRIKGAVYDGLRKTGWVPRSLYNKLKMEQDANDYFQSSTDKLNSSAVNVKDELGHVRNSVNALASVYVMSLDGMEDYEVEDKNAYKEIEHKAEFQKLKEKMRDAIEALPEKERKLIKMYYFQSRTLQEIGERLSLSKSWTSRLHARALDMLLKKLTNLNPNMDKEEIAKALQG